MMQRDRELHQPLQMSSPSLRPSLPPHLFQHLMCLKKLPPVEELNPPPKTVIAHQFPAHLHIVSPHRKTPNHIALYAPPSKLSQAGIYSFPYPKGCLAFNKVYR